MPNWKHTNQNVVANTPENKTTHSPLTRPVARTDTATPCDAQRSSTVPQFDCTFHTYQNCVPLLLSGKWCDHRWRDLDKIRWKWCHTGRNGGAGGVGKEWGSHPLLVTTLFCLETPSGGKPWPTNWQRHHTRRWNGRRRKISCSGDEQCCVRTPCRSRQWRRGQGRRYGHCCIWRDAVKSFGLKHLMPAEVSPASKMKEELVFSGNQTLIWSKDFSGKCI